jgi:hypothetical protein
MRIKHGGFSEELHRCLEKYAPAPSPLFFHPCVLFDLSLLGAFDPPCQFDLMHANNFTGLIKNTIIQNQTLIKSYRCNQ